MSHPEYAHIGRPITRVIEECAELQKALCKVERFGWFNHHPERPERANIEEVATEMDDVVEAIERLKEEMHQIRHDASSGSGPEGPQRTPRQLTVNRHEASVMNKRIVQEQLQLETPIEIVRRICTKIREFSTGEIQILTTQKQLESVVLAIIEGRTRRLLNALHDLDENMAKAAREELESFLGVDVQTQSPSADQIQPRLRARRDA